VIRARTLWPRDIGGFTFRCPNGMHWRAGTVAVPVPVARYLLLLLETPAFAARILAEHPAPPGGKAERPRKTTEENADG
jgi:hypothetical protein